MLLPPELLEIIFEFIEKDFCFLENYGFEMPKNIKENKKTIQEKNEKKFKQWKTLFEKGFKKSKDKNMKKLCYNGIPPRLRSLVWSHFLETSTFKKPGVYKQLQSRNLKNPSIEKDVLRTHYGTFFYESKLNELRNVLNAFSEYIPNMKYSAGMNYLVSILLFNMDEETAFWSLVALFNKPIYSQTFLGESGVWNKELSLFDNLLKKFLPNLVNKFDMTSMANLWIISSFSYSFQPEISCRVFDVICYEGFNAVHRIAISLLLILEKEMMNKTWDELLVYINNEIPQTYIDGNKLMNKAYSLNMNDLFIDKIRKESKYK
eukprot:gene6493-10501_t